MPSGRTHDRITFWCLPAVVIPTALITRSPVITSIVSASFLIGGLMLGPDLDIHSVQYTRWGPLRWIWLPYQIAIKHRSPISHGPIIGTALRVLYLSFWLALFALLSVETLNWVWDAKLSWEILRDPFRNLFQKYVIEWVAVVVGLELGSVSHSVSDSIGSYLVSKRKKKKRKKRRS
ncbi:MAG: metal-binding protein [Phormidesmis sp.]